jgi:2-iminobutanoate/2-iminopropanoate deaminase
MFEGFMDKIIIETKRAPKAIGPYSQAIKVGNLVFTSGQIPIDAKTGEVVNGSIGIQTRKTLDNLKEILDASGSSLNDVIKVNVYLTDLKNFVEFNEIYSMYFPMNKPARTTVEVKGLPKGVSVEIDCIAKTA